MEIFQQDYFALFTIICLGYILGNIKIKGISLDVSAIIFVALVFGHFHITVPPIIEKIGLVLFVYTIGIQAGSGFFDAFRKHGRILVIMAVSVIVSAALLSLLASYLLDIETSLSIGLLAGALTSTPGLAVAVEKLSSPLVSIGYGIAYPFGVIGVILFVRLFPKMPHLNIAQAEKDYEMEATMDFPKITNQNFVVENENIIGKTIAELKIRNMTEAVISRVMKGDQAFTPTQKTIFEMGDYIKAVGSEEALKKIGILVGSKTDKEIPLKAGYEIRSILVTNNKIVNKTLHELNLWVNYNASVAMIRRSGIDISPTPNLHLQMGDKVKIAGSKSSMKTISRILGDNDKALSSTNLFPVAAGIILGVLLGKFNLSFGENFSFSLGITGGVLVISMILSSIGKTGSIVWTMSGSANQLLRQLGLMFFLSYVGTKAGATLVETFQEYGIQLFLFGGVITIVPMLVGAFIAHIFKINPLSAMGALTGSMTSTPGLAAADGMTETNAPSVAYASVYPVAMVLLIICIQILTLF